MPYLTPWTSGIAVAGLMVLVSGSSGLAIEPRGKGVELFSLELLAQGESVEDPLAEGDRLMEQGAQEYQDNQLHEALQTWERALQIYREIGYKEGEAASLGNLSFVYFSLGDYSRSSHYLEQAIHLIEEIGGSHSGLAASLLNLSSVYQAQGDYEEAETILRRSLELSESQLGNNHPTIANIFNNLGHLYQSQGHYSEAESNFREALEINEAVLGSDHPETASTLVNLGELYKAQGRYIEAEYILLRSLSLFENMLGANHPNVANGLNSLGQLYQLQGRYAEAEPLLLRSLSIYETALGENHPTISSSLNNLGDLYLAQGHFGDYQRTNIYYEQALAYYERSLAIAREIGNRRSEGIILNDLGNASYSLGQYRESIRFHEQARQIARNIGDLQGEANALSSLGNVHAFLSEYEKAIQYHESHINLAQNLGDRRGEANGLNNLGTVYQALGDYERAIDFYQQSLTISMEDEYYQGIAHSLENLGISYFRSGDHNSAVQYTEESLSIKEKYGLYLGIVNSLNNLGVFNASVDNFEQAIYWYQEGISKAQEIKAENARASLLLNLADVYYELNNVQDSLFLATQALDIFRDLENRASEATTLVTMGRLFLDYNQPELAIVFLKSSVNVRESIRGDIRGLDISLQKSFTNTIADDYRLLADLLLQQGRILEAQRVLDLLKVQELDEYLQDVQRSAQTETGVQFWQVETDLLALYQAVLDQAAELTQLEAIPPGDRTPTDQQRLDELRAIQAEARSWFLSFLDDPQVIATLDRIRTTTQGQNLEPENFQDLTNNLRLLPQKTAALYPLILSDRLELVLILPDGPPLRYPIAVSSTELNQAIVEFGQALKSPNSIIEPLAQQLYRWLIAPMSQQLEQAGIESIIYAPDGALRYIPLAALHDGDQYLAQRFSISHITTASLTDINLEPQRQNQRLLAAACAECSFTIRVGEQEFPFADLPFTVTEVQLLAEQIDTTDVLLNESFNPAAMADLPSYGIVHMATHAAFVEGSPNESFIVFGSGETINLRDIRREWNLDNVELVVLSACETAVGSAELGSGVEILGLGYQIERAGAQATIASLWKVNDGGTQVLMNAFYTALQQGLTKAEALRQAQIALVTGDFTAVGDPRGDDGNIVLSNAETGLSVAASNNLNHPYYWAPFILIGNGL